MKVSHLLASVKPLCDYTEATAVSEEAAGPTNFGLTSLCMVLKHRVNDREINLPDTPSGDDYVRALTPLREIIAVEVPLHPGWAENELKMFDEGLQYLKKVADYKQAA
jgi:hypothetical protein